MAIWLCPTWNDDFTSNSLTTLRFPHPTKPADPAEYEGHLLNIRSDVSGTPYQAYERVIKQRFKEPDRNSDDMVGIGDLVTRMEEGATTRSLQVRE